MTRLPHPDRNVTGLDQSDGPQYVRYRVGPLCSVPGCSRLADHSHHIWRRSFVIGDKPWVKLWDGTIAGNLTGLCFHHHNDVTENKAIIEWNDSYVWRYEDGRIGLLLDPQPPILRPGATGYEIGKLSTQESSQKLGAESHDHGPGSVEKCPTCRRALPRAESKREGPRHRERWTVTVPVDERENGAEILDHLIEQCQEVFGHDETQNTRYWTLIQSLALVLQHKERLTSDG